jgi:CheY-like chemotaxis protein
MATTPAQRAHFEQLKSSGLLPSPKGPALAVLGLTRRDNVSLAQLAQAVKADPALVALLLKLANVCRAPGGRPLLAIQDALSVLGLTAVRGLALGFSLMNDSRSGACRNFDYIAFWSRNLARAVAMQAVAGITRAMPADESFTLALLAHIGELALATAFPEAYSGLLAENPASTRDLLFREQQSFGLDHADLAAILLEDWGVPAALVEPVRCHEQPAIAAFAAGSRAERVFLGLMLASRIADVCLAAKNQRRGLMAELFLLGGKLAISPETLTDLCDNMVRDWADWCCLLDVPQQTLPPFAELMKVSLAPADGPLGALCAAGDGEKIRVLVVEDDRIMRGLLKALLAHVGLDCLEAENGRQGFDLALRERPQLMIVDWSMPEMNGIELIRALRETEVGRGVYILLLTSMDKEEHLVEAFEAGADDFLTKPLKSKVLAARLRAGLRVVMLHREIERDQANLQRFAVEFAALNQRLQESRPACLPE